MNGKTGARWLIAKHRAVDVLRRLHARQRDIADIPFDELFDRQLDLRVFRASDGSTFGRMDSTWHNLIRASGMLKDAAGQNRSMYSLLTPQQIAAWDADWEQQRELRRRKRARTKEEDAALGWRDRVERPENTTMTIAKCRPSSPKPDRADLEVDEITVRKLMDRVLCASAAKISTAC